MNTIIQKLRSVELCMSAHPDNEFDSEFADRISDIEEIKNEVTQLLEWKESALKVMNNIDLQKVGQLINVPLGADVSTEILPFIEKTVAQRNALVDLLSDAVDLVSNLPYDENLQETKGNFVMNAQSVIYDIKGNAPDLLTTK